MLKRLFVCDLPVFDQHCPPYKQFCPTDGSGGQCPKSSCGLVYQFLISIAHPTNTFVGLLNLLFATNRPLAKVLNLIKSICYRLRLSAVKNPRTSIESKRSNEDGVSTHNLSVKKNANS
jgi:hypothetical protein